MNRQALDFHRSSGAGVCGDARSLPQGLAPGYRAPTTAAISFRPAASYVGAEPSSVRDWK